MIKDYNTYAFEQERDWDEDIRTAAKKANENAFKMLRTLFNDIPAFSSKNAGQAWLTDLYNSNNKKAIETLMESCEQKLKPFIAEDNSEYREASTLAQLRAKLDPLVCSSSLYDKPAYWPLVQQVRFVILQVWHEI